MNKVTTLERPAGVEIHHPDTIDQIAELHAHELVERTAEQIQAEKAAELIKIFDKLNAQYAKRRVGSTVHVGDIISESVTFATRTPDWRRLDEIFTRETIYDPILKRPMSRYTVQLLGEHELMTTVTVNSDSSMSFVSERGGKQWQLDEEAANDVMLDLVVRAEMAVGAYEMRKEAAAEQGIDPHLYSDLADADARDKLIRTGFNEPVTTTLE